MGENIKLKPEVIRVALGLSQKEFADKLGISVRVYQKRIHKESEWKATEITKMSELANVPMNEIEY